MRGRGVGISAAAGALACALCCVPVARLGAAGDSRTITGYPTGSTSASGSQGLSFQTDLFTGGFTYRVPIAVPPGRQGAEPNLALAYSSSGGNGWCGVGWNLELGFIQRETRKGVPIGWSGGQALARYDDAKGFVFFLGGASSRLVQVAPGQYRAATDSAFLRFEYADPHWVVTDKSGNEFYFGETAAGRMENPRFPAGLGSSTFRWALSRVVDANGNLTEVTYAKDGGQLYLSQIAYNGSAGSPAIAPCNTVDFVIEDRPDKAVALNAGFRVEIRKRLREIVVAASGNLARRYVLSYAPSPSTYRSRLVSVTQFGADDTASLPPLTFAYQDKPFAFGDLADWADVYSQGDGGSDWNAPRSRNYPKGRIDTRVDLVDMDSDGLPDRLMRKREPQYLYFAVQRNTGSGFAPAQSFYRWSPIDHQGQGAGNEKWCSPRSIDDDGSHLVDLFDIDGDGLADRVMRRANSPYTNYVVQINAGLPDAGDADGYGPAVAWGPLLGNYTALRDGPQNGKADLIDMDGDGLPDRVMRPAASPYDRFLVQRNTGGGFGPLLDWAGVDTPGAGGAADWNSLYLRRTEDGKDVSKVEMLDINGDGLPDRVMRTFTAPHTNLVVQLNNGAGFEAAENWGPLSSQGQGNDKWNSPLCSDDSGVFTDLADINGDGLPDRVMRRLNSPYDRFVVQLNTGSGLGPEVAWTNLQAESPAADWQSPRSTKSDGVGRTDLIDIDGDGLVDRVSRRSNSPYNRFKVQLNKGPAPDLLVSVANGIGGTVSITYRASTAYNNRDRDVAADPWDERARSLLPFPVWTVASVTTDDGMGNADTTTYSYLGGMFHFGLREFRGFARAEVTLPGGERTVTWFHQGGGRDESARGEFQDAGALAKAGIPYRIELWGSDARLYRQTLSRVEEAAPLGNTNGWTFPYVAQTIAMDFDGHGHYRATAKQFAYDTATGNLLAESSLGEVTSVDAVAQSFSDVPGDEVYTHTTYAALPDPDIVNRPQSVRVTSDPAGNSRLRETQFGYDARGNVTSQSVWLDTAGGWITSTIGYDAHGNPTSKVNPVGIATTITYDAATSTFPATQTTAGFTSSTTYDPRSGQITEATDAKNQRALNLYDAFFRLTESRIGTTPGGAATLWKVRVAYNLGGIDGGGLSHNWVRRRVNDAVDAANGHETWTYTDGLGRTIQTRAEAETGGQFRVADTLYDERGNANFETLPYFSGGSSFTAWSPSVPGTATDHDAISRPWRVTPPAGDPGSPTAPATTAYVDGTDPWARVTTDPLGKVKKTYLDAYGRTAEIIEVASGGNVTTTFNYDLLGNLLAVIDSANHTTSMAYDSLGRKTSMTEPNMGAWSYAYDDAGRMTWQQDAKGQRVEFFYQDPLGRLSQKNIRAAGGGVVASHLYHYDSGDASHAVFPGQLYMVEDSEGWTKYSYDVRGRVLKTTRYLLVNNGTYATETSYDDADRPATLIYPGAVASLGYAYDTAGHLAEVRSLSGTGAQEVFYTAAGFNALDQPVAALLGNGLGTTWEYYPNSKRLSRLATTGSSAVQDLSYTYDAASNVKSIADAVRTGAASASMTDIGYDDLHRLTCLTSAGQGGMAFAYDPIGNITANGEGAGSYTYHATKPHAVASANGKSYAYDACGNMTARGSQSLAYDEQNRLAWVTTSSNTVAFGYDDAGQRLWKDSAAGLQVWIGGIYEEKNGKALCHVFAEGRRIATFEPVTGLSALMQSNGTLASIDSGLRWLSTWPLQGGRTPFTLMLLGLAAILCAMAAPRLRTITENGTRKTENALRRAPAWQQATAVLTAVMLFVSTSHSYASATYDPVFYYCHPDHLGSSSVLTDRAGELVQVYGYSAFGRSWHQDNAQAFPVSDRFTGHDLDEDTGLYYCNARYYDPEIGRFIQPDSIVPDPADSQAYNRYSYVRNSPLVYTDPSGHFWQIVGIIALFAATGAALGAMEAANNGGDLGKGALTGAAMGAAAGVGYSLGLPVAFGFGGGQIEVGVSSNWGGGSSPHGGDTGSGVVVTRGGGNGSGGGGGGFGEGVGYDGTFTIAAELSSLELSGPVPQSLSPSTGVFNFEAQDWLSVSNAIGEVISYAPGGWGLLGSGIQAGVAITRKDYGALAGIGGGTAIGLVGGKLVGKLVGKAAKTEKVQRWMSRAELENVRKSGLFRGGRGGTHHATDAANSNPLRARQRLSLDHTPEVRVELEVPAGRFSQPTRVAPLIEKGRVTMPGGGMERTAVGDVPTRVIKVVE